MPKLLDADTVRRIILSHGGDAAMLREIERLPDKRKEPAPGWISVEERRPDGTEGDWVLGVVYGRGGTHWMPLPELPKSERAD